MPILPPHQQRQVAESFGVDPDRYDRARPDYPAALIAEIAAAGPRVLDAGCGTGIAARQLQAAGCEVLGVEPDERMAAHARSRGLPVELSTFERWEPAGRTFDAVIAAQAWHWVEPAAGAAKVAEVLRPGGRLAVFWNVDRTPPELAEAFAAVYRRVLPGSPILARMEAAGADAYDPLCAAAEEGIRGTGAFAEPERRRHDWRRAYTREQWLDLLPTQGLFTRLPADAMGEILTGVGEAIGSGFEMRYSTVAVIAERLRPAAAGAPPH